MPVYFFYPHFTFNSQISIERTSVNIMQKERQETPLFLTDYHEMRFGDEGGGELRFCLSCGTLLGLFDQDFQRKNLDTDCCTKDRKILCCSDPQKPPQQDYFHFQHSVSMLSRE